MYRVVTHRVYKIFQGALAGSFLILSALHGVDIDYESKTLYWKGVSFYLAVVLLDYFISLVAFGYQPKHRSYLIFDTAVCLIAYSLRQSNYTLED